MQVKCIDKTLSISDAFIQLSPVLRECDSDNSGDGDVCVPFGSTSVTPLMAFADIYSTTPYHLPPILTKTSLDQNIDDQYKQFLAPFFQGPSKRRLYDVMEAANYFGVEPLLTLCGARLACLLMCTETKDFEHVLQ